MKQQTLAMAADQGAGFERYRRRTKREDILDAMNTIVPWAELCTVIEPHYPKAGNGRRPIGLERMLRIHLLQHWFNLADNAVEEALYDIASLRRFVGIDLGAERVPDETTVLNFRHLLEQHDLGKKLFSEVGRVLQTSGFQLKTGTIVDATLIGAPSSTKNADKARDPEMHQTRKGQQWCRSNSWVQSISRMLASGDGSAGNSSLTSRVGATPSTTTRVAEGPLSPEATV